MKIHALPAAWNQLAAHLGYLNFGIWAIFEKFIKYEIRHRFQFRFDYPLNLGHYPRWGGRARKEFISWTYRIVDSKP